MQTTPLRNQGNHGISVPESGPGDAYVGGVDIPVWGWSGVAYDGGRNVGSCAGGWHSDWNGLGVCR